MSFKNISIETTSEVLSSHSGLFLHHHLWKSLRLDKKLRSALPRKKRKKGLSSVAKLKALVFSFAVGK